MKVPAEIRPDILDGVSSTLIIQAVSSLIETVFTMVVLLGCVALAVVVPIGVLLGYWLSNSRGWGLFPWVIASLQVAAYATLFVGVEWAPGYWVPLSVTIFPATLMVLLLTYAKKAVSDFRSIFLYGLIIPQLGIFSVVLCTAGAYQLASVEPPAVFQFRSAVLLVLGFVALLCGLCVMITIYDSLAQANRRITRTGLPLVATLTIDAVLMTCVIWQVNLITGQDFAKLLLLQLLSKLTVGGVYAILLTAYAHFLEPDLFLDVPARPSGYEFLESMAYKSVAKFLLPLNRPGIIQQANPRQFFLDMDSLLGLAYQDHFTPIGLYIFKHSPGSPTSPKCIDQLTRGRFFGRAHDFDEVFVLVIHGAERERLKSLEHQFNDCFPESPCELRIYPDLERAESKPEQLRRLASAIVADHLTDEERKTYLAAKQDHNRNEVLRINYRAMLRMWKELAERYTDDYVAFHDGVLLGHGASSHELYWRYIAQNRPASSLVVMRISDETHDFIEQTATALQN